MTQRADRVHSAAIIGPIDANDAKTGIEAAINTWNNVFGKTTGHYFLAKRWPNDTVPDYRPGMDGQQMTTEQIIRDSEIVFAVFRARLGTPTLRSKSGTAEEIETAIRLGKPCHVYFHIDPHQPNTELSETARLNSFKESLEDRGFLTGRWPVPDGFGGLVAA